MLKFSASFQNSNNSLLSHIGFFLAGKGDGLRVFLMNKQNSMPLHVMLFQSPVTFILPKIRLIKVRILLR